MHDFDDSDDNQSSFDNDDSYSDGNGPKNRIPKKRGRKPKAFKNLLEENVIAEPFPAQQENDCRNDRLKRVTRQVPVNSKSLLQQQKEVDQQIMQAEQEEQAQAAELALQNGDDGGDNQLGGIFFPEIELILWKRDRPDGTPEYLVKYKEYSYQHCEWLEESEVVGESKAGKNKLNRFHKTFEKKIREGDYETEGSENERYFDQTYIEVDRILQCIVPFPIIHTKKSNEIKGKWSELLVMIASKLLCFTKDAVHYGVYFMEPVNPERENCLDYKKKIQTPMDLGTLSNRLYLDYYKTSTHFFNELGLVFKNCRVYNTNPDSDIRILCDTLREAAILMYDEWHQIETMRYEYLVEEQRRMTSIEYIRKREEEKRAQLLKLQEKRKKQFQKQIIAITKELISIQSKVEEEDASFDLMGAIKEFVRKNQDQINNNITLKDIDQKDEAGIITVMNIFIQANRFLLEVEFSDEEVEEVTVVAAAATKSAPPATLTMNGHKNGEENMEVENQPANSTELTDAEKDEKKKAALAKFVEGLVASAKGRSRNAGAPYPLTVEEIERYNPGKLSYAWVTDSLGPADSIGLDQNMYIVTQEDIESNNISLTIDPDMIYLVKWKNLSYLESTWEHESLISNPAKINDFKMFNRALDKESRQILNLQAGFHQILVDIEVNMNMRKKQQIGAQGLMDARNKLFFYDVGLNKKPFQYTQQNQPIYKQRKLLRYYQLESLNWMIESWYAKRNVILADEMGLGKTIQSTAFINHLYTFENLRGPFLIIAPLSTLEHWKRSVDDWTNLNAVLYYDHSGLDGRNCCRHYEWFHTDISMRGATIQANDIYKFQVLITSNEVFLSDAASVLVNIPFQFIVVDEAHRLKNQNAKILTALKRLPCKRTLLLTGTPIQNNTEELWTLLNYIEPSKFTSLQEFKEAFGELQNKEQVDILQAKIKPYLLRRMKEDVEDSIPALQETIIDIEMTTIQKTLYRAIYERNKSMLQKTFSSTAMNAPLNNLEMQLRKCCNHPFLIKEIEADLTAPCVTIEDRFKVLIETSGKMILLDKLVVKYKQEGKKVLIFSQFVYVLQLLEEYLRFRGMKYEKIDGSVKSKERQNSIDRFNDPEKKRDVFLLSTKAGGLGINLTSANIVIIFDSDWNPQNDVQATARAHRIGQTQEVSVYRFVTKKTYEAEMFERATKKLGLDQAIFMGGEFKQAHGSGKDDSKKLGKQDVENLLKKGILGLVNEEEESKRSTEFFEEDIDNILKNNTRIAKYSVINGSYSFSKGSFVSNKADTDLKIDDPNFWNKVLKDQESKTLLVVKEFDTREKIILASQDEQRIFFFKVCEFVNELISSKLTLVGYNADDEKNVTDVLNKIISSKDFNPKYKDLAMNFTYEVQRPSRRFKKVTMQDLDFSSNGDTSSNTKGQQESAKKQNGNQDDNDLFYENDSDGQFEEEEEVEGAAPTDKKPASTKESQSGAKEQAAVVCRREDFFKKLCYYCDRAKCTFFCQGHCRRNFHSECKDRVNSGWINVNGMTPETLVTPAEEHYDEEKIKKLSDHSFICSDCQQNLAICFVCKKKGQYYPASQVGKRPAITSTATISTARSTNNNNTDEDGVVANEEDIDIEDGENDGNGNEEPTSPLANDNQANVLTKCSTANCNKFYHTECIKPFPLFKFIDQHNRRFRCPLHYCMQCHVSGDSMAISQCVRCPTACHLRCFEKQKVIKLSKKIMLCDKHPHNMSKPITSQNGRPSKQSSSTGNGSSASRVRSAPQNSDDSDIVLKKIKTSSTGSTIVSLSNMNGIENSAASNGGVENSAEKGSRATRMAQNTQQSQISAYFGKKGNKITLKMEEKANQNGANASGGSGGEGEDDFDAQEDIDDVNLEELQADDIENDYQVEIKPVVKQRQPRQPRQKKRPPPQPVIPKEREKPLFTYEDFKIPAQKDFNYEDYHRDWCRYCGARFSSNITKGPWGPRTLCTVHYIAWGQKKKLDLKAYKDLPTRPINPDDLTELNFMSRLKVKDESFDPESQLKEMVAYRGNPYRVSLQQALSQAQQVVSSKVEGHAAASTEVEQGEEDEEGEVVAADGEGEAAPEVMADEEDEDVEEGNSSNSSDDK